MNAVAFDTLAYVKRLRDAGMEPALAEAQAEALAGAVQATLATKQDVETAKEQVLGELNKPRTEFNGLRGEFDKLRAEFNGLRGEFDKLRAEFNGLRGEFDKLRAEFNGLRGEFDKLRAEFSHLRGELRAEIRDSQLALVKWFVPLLLGQTAAIVALVKLL